MNDIIPHRVWVGIVLMLAAVLSVSAQGDTALHDTDITRKERVAEMVPSLNLVAISTNKKSLALGGLATIVRERAYGLQIGGLYNHVGDMGRGIAIAGIILIHFLEHIQEFLLSIHIVIELMACRVWAC